MTVFSVVLAALLAPMVAVAAINLLRAPRLHRVAPASDGPRVSLLIPARNEAENLCRLLPAVARLRYPDLEIRVLDDGSTDGTAAVVREHAAADPRLRLLEGAPPPEGWSGKNWACGQLAEAARGELLMFCDADVVPGSDAVGRTVTALTAGGADVVTAFPRHERGGWFADAVIPLVAKLPIAALLPLPLVRRTRSPSLAVGNGQWLAWRREAYARVGGHARVRDDVLEDVRLARLAKAEGLQLAPYVASRDLSIRMYRSRAATREGFAKNVYPLAGGRDAVALPALGLYLLALGGPLLPPLLAPASPEAWLPLALLATLRLLAAWLFHDPARSLLLHPVGVPALASVALLSRHRHRRGEVFWKERTLHRGKMA